MNRLIVLSGAGLSAESGIPTFRDSGGLWEGHDVNTVANYHTLKKNKELVFKFYNERRAQMVGVKPNAAHESLAKLQREFGNDQVILITQNIDNLLEDAGAQEVLHVHGNINEGQCLANPNHRWILEKDLELTDRCPHCAGGIKPGVVLFNEHAPNYGHMFMYFESLTENDVFMVIGTNGQVIYPIEALKSKAYKVLITIDSGAYDTSYFDTHIVTPAGIALPELEETIRKHLRG